MEERVTGTKEGRKALIFLYARAGARRSTTHYGASGEKMLYGRKLLGVVRSTFIFDFDARGVVGRVFPRVAGHVEKVLEALEAL